MNITMISNAPFAECSLMILESAQSAKHALTVMIVFNKWKNKISDIKLAHNVDKYQNKSN